MATKSLIGNTLAARLAAVPSSATTLGAMGAFVGGVTATAQNTYKVAKGEMNGMDAALNVARETVGTGLSTAAGAAAMTVLGLGGVAGMAGLVVVASLAKGAWDRAFAGQSATSES